MAKKKHEAVKQLADQGVETIPMVSGYLSLTARDKKKVDDAIRGWKEKRMQGEDWWPF